MNATTSGNIFLDEMVQMLPGAIAEGMKIAAHIMWDAAMVVLSENTLAIVGFLLFIFVVAMLKAMMGRWGMLGSFMYNFLYFGILLVVGLIWGPEVFVHDAFRAACTVILYPICYWVTGRILDATGLTHRFAF